MESPEILKLTKEEAKAAILTQMASFDETAAFMERLLETAKGFRALAQMIADAHNLVIDRDGKGSPIVVERLPLPSVPGLDLAGF